MSFKINSINVEKINCCIGFGPFPGRRKSRGSGKILNRDIYHDLGLIKKWGARTIISLIEAREISETYLKLIAGYAYKNKIKHIHFPIKDYAAPEMLSNIQWQKIKEDLHRGLANNEPLFIHCKGGLGRSGTICAQLLIEHGYTVEFSLKNIRNISPGAIETSAQLNYLYTIIKNI